MSIKIYYIIYHTILLSAVIAGWINYRKAVRPMLFLVILITYTSLSQAVSYWAAVVYRNNIAVDNVYSPVSVLLYGLFFYEVIINEKWRRVMLYLAMAIFVFAIINIIWIEPIHTKSANLFQLKTIYLFAGGAILLLQQIDLPGDKFVFKDPVFLSGLTLVWFNTISSIYFYFSKFIAEYKIKVPFLTYVHFFSNYVHYLIFFLAMIYIKNYKSYARELYG